MKAQYRWIVMVASASIMLVNAVYANDEFRISDLPELNLEELGNIEITSVSKHAQKLHDAAASVYVITQEDIRRSGATTISEVLRLAPNLQVAQYSSNGYAISARGFNTTTTDKLLVLIDGRSVYTPLYSGVFWDMQDTMMEDIDRIEVISGPGASLWGANAVNGVVNIITKNTMDTQGTLATVSGGSEEKSGGVRYGGLLSNGAAYRVYGKYTDHGASVNAAGTPKQDAWENGQAGFRLDRTDAEHSLTLQGDVYKGSTEQTNLDDRTVESANLLGRWGHNLARGHLQIQAYLEHTKRDQPGTFDESLDTADLDVQHQFRWKTNNVIVWGGGYRYSIDRVQTTAALAFLPSHANLDTANLFFQDQIDLVPEALQLTAGTKFEHNNYSGLDIQPDVRLSWNVNERHQLWSAISRAARAPSRVDRDLYIPAPPVTPGTPSLAGGSGFKSETLTAYQLGYHGRLSSRSSVSVTLFYNDYKKLRTLDRDLNGVYTINNNMEGTTRGVEFWGEFQVMPAWRMYPGYTYLEENLHLLPGSTNPSGTASEGNDPVHQFFLRTSLDLPHNVEFDAMVRRIGALPVPAVPSYTAVNLRLGWKVSRYWELSLIARNALDPQHPEFGSSATRSEIQRNVFVKSTWTF